MSLNKTEERLQCFLFSVTSHNTWQLGFKTFAKLPLKISTLQKPIAANFVTLSSQCRKQEKSAVNLGVASEKYSGILYHKVRAKNSPQKTPNLISQILA